jgi:hypothetical protein
VNRGAIRSAVRDVIGELVADFWSDAELNRYIDQGHFRFLKTEHWPWLLTASTLVFTGGVAFADLPENIDPAQIVAFKLGVTGATNVYQPVRVSAMKGFALEARFNSSTSTTYPGWFYVSQVTDADNDALFLSRITLVPAPSTGMTLTFVYRRPIVEFTADADVPVLPVEYHMAIAHYAASQAFLKELNGGGKASEQLGMYRGIVEQCSVEFLREPDGEPLIAGANEPQYRDAGGSSDWDPQFPDTLGP